MDDIWIRMRIKTLIIQKLTFFQVLYYYNITIYFSCIYLTSHFIFIIKIYLICTLLAIVTAISFKNDKKKTLKYLGVNDYEYEFQIT